MRGKVVILLVAWMLVTMVAGCGGAHRYDGRLVQADSLMPHDPDSALALVQGISPDSLPTPGDRAYRDLLLTQGRYKCYITATSDSDINRALAYYSHHSDEREKLTRAYIYKGAVMEELGYPDSAMTYYKNAEATVSSSDYANLGQINLRIAALYRKYYGNEEICFDKYHNALKYFKLTNNKHFQRICLFNMALCRAIARDDVCKVYLKRAHELAVQLNDSSAIFECEEFLCRYLSHNDSALNEAKQIGLKCLQNHSEYINLDILQDLSFVYAKLNLNDSARLYFDGLYVIDTSTIDVRCKMKHYWILSIMALNEGDTARSNYYSNLKSRISDSIDNNKTKNYIQRIENTGNKDQARNKDIIIFGLHKSIVILFLLAFVIFVSIIGFHFYREKRVYAIVKGIKKENLENHLALLNQINYKDTVITNFAQNMVTFIQVAIDASENDSPKVLRRKIKEALPDVANDDFWKALFSYLDKKYNNLISTIAQNPKISDVDLRFIGLSCFGFSYVELAITLGFTPTYVSKKRRMIAKKMGLKVPLQDFLSDMTKQ